MQPDLFTLDDLDVRDVAYYAEIAIHRGWDTAAQQAMNALARRGTPFTADDFRRLMADAPAPHHPNVIGSYFRRARADGLIKPTGQFRCATTASRHGAAIREWVGVQPDTQAA